MTLYGKRIKSRVKTVLPLQHCSIQCSAAESLNTLQPISQPFLNGFSWNWAWLFLRFKQSSLDTKQWPCSTAVFHAVHAECLSIDWAEITLQAITLPFLNLLRWNFFWWLYILRGSNFFKISIFWSPWGNWSSFLSSQKTLALPLLS